MPKPANKYDRQHLINLQRLQQQIDEIYKVATREAAAIGVTIDNFNPDRPFSFDDYPLTRMQVESLMMRFKASVEVCVVNGIESEWTLANNKNNALANRVFGNNIGRLTNEQYRRYYTTNEDARDAFIQRKENGLSLSDRVWRYTNEFKDEIEMSLDLGLRGGLTADKMAKELRQYLQHPDMLFRRVRDEHGILHLSKHAAAFHPGRGVYRSSYMNARRLAATEGNIAYRTSDHLRWQEMDFVVGIEIHLSNNHTCKGSDGKPHEFHDMCDELAGRYPKDFKFTGWHPHCRCYATTILKTDEEIARDTQKILNGEPLDGESVNRVKDVPQGFKDWVSKNKERIEKAQSLPYFLKDNESYVKDALADKFPFGYDWTQDIMKMTDAKAEVEIIQLMQEKWDKSWDDIYKFMDAHPDRKEGLIELYKQIYGEDSDYKGYYSLNKYQLRHLNSLMNEDEHSVEMAYNKQYGYIATRNYRKINGHLRGIKSLEQWESEGELDDWEVRANYDTINSLDKLVRDNEVTENIVLHRFARENYLSGVFGVPSGSSLDVIEAFMKQHVGRITYDKGFFSTSAMIDANAFTDRPLYIKILAPKGTKAYVTHNFGESEVVLGREQEFKILSVKQKKLNGEQGLEMVFQAV